MKKIILILHTLLFFANAFSQNKAELLNYHPVKSDIDSIAESLADIALQNPSLKSIEADTKSDEYTWRASKLTILNDISIAGNLNEYSIKGSSNNPTNRNLLYPRYNFGVRVPIGEIFTTGKTAKANYYRYESQVEKLKNARQNLRREVIIAYLNYATTQKLLALQQEVLQDGLVALTKAEEKFKNGELSLELYTNASKAYNNEQVKEVTLTSQLKMQQATLEALIGMPLQDAFTQIKATNQ